jgi:iron complex outermembrane recepter protein
MKKILLTILAVTVGVILCLSDVPQVRAADSGSEEFTLEEITVTAQKRAENQQKVAIAMDVISAESINEIGRTNLDQILDNVSNAVIQKAADGLRISLRGIADDTVTNYNQSMATPTVAVNMDGVYSNRKDTGAGLYDVERVEVLYGPQSTMYASNSPGGVVNVITAAPKINKYEFNGSVGVGTYKLRQYQAAANVPLGGKIALRASGAIQKRKGYLSGGNDNMNNQSGRFRALFEPSDSLSITLTQELSKNKSLGTSGGVTAFNTQDGLYMSGTYNTSTHQYNTAGPVTNPWTSVQGNSLRGNNQKGRKTSLSLEWDMGSIGTMTFVPAYSTRNGNSMMWFPGGTTEYVYSLVREKSADLRMVSSSDFFFKWILGFNYLKSKDIQNMMSAAFVLGTPGADYSFRTNFENAKAIYANVTYPITDKFRGTLGLRKSWDKMTTHNDEVKGGRAQPGGTPQNSPNSPNYKLGFEYDLGANSMLYANYDTSYRVQAMSQSTKPMQLKAYSLGAKNRFFGNKLQVNAATYYYDYKNYKVSYSERVWKDDNNDGLQPANANPPPGTVSEFKADTGASGKVADARVYGLDLSMDAALSSQDMLNASAAYVKSEWKSLVFHWYYTTQDILVNGVKFANQPHPDADYSGRPMSYTPPWTFNLNYSHSFYLWNGGVLKVNPTFKYQTEYRLSWQDSYMPFCLQEKHHMENINMSYSDPSGKWTLAGYVNNIENYAEKRSFMFAGASAYMSIGDPRTYGVQLSVKF